MPKCQHNIEPCPICDVLLSMETIPEITEDEEEKVDFYCITCNTCLELCSCCLD